MCAVIVEADGIDFPPASIEVGRIKEDADYGGVRVRFHATLAKARIPMQIDIGFGDVIVPQPVEVEYPALLEFPPPILMAYPKETVEAIGSTFRHRETVVEEVPIGLTGAFSSDPARATQWRAFLRRSRFDLQTGLDRLVDEISMLLPLTPPPPASPAPAARPAAAGSSA